MKNLTLKEFRELTKDCNEESILGLTSYGLTTREDFLAEQKQPTMELTIGIDTIYTFTRQTEEPA